MAIELENTFTVPVPPEQAWDVLLDVERIAPCMPGASVQSVEGDSVDGQVKVKLGPLSLTYKGTAKFTDKDQANHTFSLDASGKETRGAGTASAIVAASLKPADVEGSTLVLIQTSLNVTGRPAQFGRSLLPEVSGKLIAQFATNLEAMINADNASAATDEAAVAVDTAVEPAGERAGEPDAAEPVTVAAQPAPVAAPRPAAPVAAPEESLNAFTFVVIPVLKRLLPVAAVAGVVGTVAVVVRRVLRRKSA